MGVALVIKSWALQGVERQAADPDMRFPLPTGAFCASPEHCWMGTAGRSTGPRNMLS
jgi:hypothetical protein